MTECSMTTPTSTYALHDTHQQHGDEQHDGLNQYEAESHEEVRHNDSDIHHAKRDESKQHDAD